MPESGAWLQQPGLDPVRDQQHQEEAFAWGVIGEGIGLALLLVLGERLWTAYRRRRP